MRYSVSGIMHVESNPNNKITELKEEIKILQRKKSSLLRVKDKTINDKIELNLASKLIRNKLRQKNSLKREEIINNPSEGNRNIKKMRKQLNPGTQWTTHFLDPKGKKSLRKESHQRSNHRILQKAI